METILSGATERCSASDTKYRVIADGNVLMLMTSSLSLWGSDTKYRVIADGNALDFFTEAV